MCVCVRVGGGLLPISHNCSAWECVCTSPASAPGRGRLEDARVSFVALCLLRRRAEKCAAAPPVGFLAGRDHLSQVATPHFPDRADTERAYK